MSVFISLRDAIYDSFSSVLPGVQFVQAYSNHPELVTPYATFNIMPISQAGRESSEGGGGLAYEVGTTNTYAQETLAHFVVKVQVEFIGKADAEDAAATLADDFFFLTNTPQSQEFFMKNNLSYLRKSSMRRVPRKRETDWYIAYQFDVFFGYQVVRQQAVDIIERVELEGNYIADSGTVTTINQTIFV